MSCLPIHRLLNIFPTSTYLVPSILMINRRDANSTGLQHVNHSSVVERLRVVHLPGPKYSHHRQVGSHPHDANSTSSQHVTHSPTVEHLHDVHLPNSKYSHHWQVVSRPHDASSNGSSHVTSHWLLNIFAKSTCPVPSILIIDQQLAIIEILTCPAHMLIMLGQLIVSAN
ncbi:hypothetical protein AMTR_s00034p00171010 [Amborella trichopoda]|uniref:Uncharacterized protein n=1 Tax=Amborella trichopoda TaxID=13333 RepID=W1PXP9_AMBTC|nr:hypothetical protein AMTR_s00034p00171010 [Amborella trichopoda]